MFLFYGDVARSLSFSMYVQIGVYTFAVLQCPCPIHVFLYVYINFSWMVLYHSTCYTYTLNCLPDLGLQSKYWHKGFLSISPISSRFYQVELMLKSLLLQLCCSFSTPQLCRLIQRDLYHLQNKQNSNALLCVLFFVEQKRWKNVCGTLVLAKTYKFSKWAEHFSSEFFPCSSHLFKRSLD